MRRDELVARRARRRPGERLPWPKPQNAQPTMQTLETLRLRLTTKVTVSPASSARRASAAWRMSSIASGRVSANRAVTSPASSGAPARARASVSGRRAPSGRSTPARAAARDEAPVARLDDVEHALRDPLRVDEARVHAQPLGQRDAVLREPLAHLVGRREGMLGRDVVAVGRQPAEVGRARRDEPRPPVGQVGRDLDGDLGHQPARLAPRAAPCPPP